MNKYILPLKDVCRKYQWIPTAEGGRSELHDWAKKYDSGFSLYHWCEGRYLKEMEEVVRDYIHVFCECIKKSMPLNDSVVIPKKAAYMGKYRYDYAYKDPGSNPLRNHFGEEWGK